MIFYGNISKQNLNFRLLGLHILYVLPVSGSPSATDSAFIGIFRGAGCRVTQHSASSDIPANMNPYNLVFLSDTASSSDIGTKWLNVTQGVINCKGDSWVSNNLTDAVFSIAVNTSLTFLGGSEIGSGYSGDVAFLSSSAQMIRADTLSSDAIVVAHMVGSPTRQVIFAYERGSTLLNSFVSPGRRVAMGFHPDTMTLFNGDGKKILLSAIGWASAPGTFGYRYYRISDLVNNGNTLFLGVNTLALYEEVGGTNIAPTSGGYSSASTTYSPSYPPEDAFDDSVSTGWLAAVEDAPHWLQFDFVLPKRILQYDIGAYPTTTNTDTRSLNSWVFQGSNNGTTWVTLDTVTGETGWSYQETRSFTLTQTSSTSLVGVGSTSTSMSTYPKVSSVTSGNKYVDASVGSSGDGNSLVNAYKTIQEGLSELSSGQTLVVKGGTYVIGSQITRNTNWGSETKIMAYGTDRPVLDATGITANTSAIRFNSGANNETWHGFYVKNVPSAGGGYDGQAVLLDQATNIKISNFHISHCQQTGIQLYSADDCTIQDCVIWRLGDGSTTLTDVPDCISVTGGVGNPSLRADIIRCVVANGPDDGIDLYRGQDCNVVDCVAYRTGYYWNNNNAGDGNGFKLGGASDGNDNLLTGSIAINSRINGINCNTGDTISVTYCTTVGAVEYGLDGNGDDAAEDNTFTGIISLGNTYTHYAGTYTTHTYNTWNLSITDASFSDTANYDWSLGTGSDCIGAGPTSNNIGASDVALLLAKEWIPYVISNS